MTEYAEFVGSRLQPGDDLPLEKFYDKIKERVKAAFPNKFENKNRNKVDLQDIKRILEKIEGGAAW